MKEIKALYVQFSGRVKDGRHIAAACIYADKELSDIKAIDVCEMTNYELNKTDKYDVYRNRLAELYVALNLIYKHQASIADCEYDTVVLCPSNEKLYKWLSQEQKVPTQIKPLFESIFKQFRIDGDSQIDVCVGLSVDVCDNKAYKFCKEEYVGKRLTKYKRGVHIMTDEECRQEDERIALQEQKARKEREKQLLEQGVSIFDILQPAQGDAFEPTVQFTSE